MSARLIVEIYHGLFMVWLLVFPMLCIYLKVTDPIDRVLLGLFLGANCLTMAEAVETYLERRPRNRRRTTKGPHQL